MNADEYLRTFSVDVPEWLRRILTGEEGSKPDLIKAFLASRTVYYPGSGADGSPVALFNQSQAAHCFIYCDSGLSFEDLQATLQEAPFNGYERFSEILITDEDLKEAELIPPARPGYLVIEPVPQYALLVLFKRMADKDARHGGEAFAVLFLAWDGFDAFEAVFGQPKSTKPPFCVVVQDHGQGGNSPSEKFGGGGRLEGMAEASNSLPDMILVDEMSDAWQGYLEPHQAGQSPHGVHGWRGGIHGNVRQLMLRPASSAPS